MNNSNSSTAKADGRSSSTFLPPSDQPFSGDPATSRLQIISSGAAVVVASAGMRPAVASAEDDAVIPAPMLTDSNEGNQTGTRTITVDGRAPAVEIPPEESGQLVEDDDEQNYCTPKGYSVLGSARNIASDSYDQGTHEDEDDESEYEYEDDEDAAFSGFLITSQHAHTSSSTTSGTKRSNENKPTEPARIVEEEAVVGTSAAPASTANDDQRKKWREPSRAAVNMSLRAQQETTGSKRRLAQDLYRIMNQDTEEAGFSLAPQSEDSMDKWTIKLFQFDQDSSLAKDMLVVGIDNIELEMKFPDQYPFEPPFVRVVKPRFKRQTGFVMNGALCMELLTKDGWNPINDIESVIVSIRSLLVVGDGRLQAAADLPDSKYQALLNAASDHSDDTTRKRQRVDGNNKSAACSNDVKPLSKEQVGTYTSAEAQAAYSHLSDYHKKKGWDTSGWWARKG